MSKALVIAFLAGALLAAGLTWAFIARPQIKLVEAERDAANVALSTTKEALERCKVDEAGATASLESLREQGSLRAQQSQMAVDAALEANRKTGEAVQMILAEQTPAGVDACIAAAAAFDAELRQERAR